MKVSGFQILTQSQWKLMGVLNSENLDSTGVQTPIQQSKICCNLNL